VSPDFRKVALIAASLGLIVSLFFALRPNDDEDAAGTTTTPATTPTPETTTAPETTTTQETQPATTAGDARPGTVHIDYTIEGGTPVGGIFRDSVARGRIVVLTTTADVVDHVHLHGYDLVADVAPGKPARITFTANAPGRFEIELEERGVAIAELEVRA
jgi:hypothetical protein